MDSIFRWEVCQKIGGGWFICFLQCSMCLWYHIPKIWEGHGDYILLPTPRPELQRARCHQFCCSSKRYSTHIRK